jgi:HlyD family secretion protein
LPRGPFVESEGGRFVYIVEAGVARRQAIKMGATSITAVELQEGLKLGDQVVIAGSELFENALSVSLNGG